MFYVTVAWLFEELKIAHDDGSFTHQLAEFAKIEVLIREDWNLQDLDHAARNDLLEVFGDRVRTRSTVIASLLLLEHWPDGKHESTSKVSRRYDGDPRGTSKLNIRRLKTVALKSVQLRRYFVPKRAS